MRNNNTTPRAAPTPQKASKDTAGERLQNILSHRGVASRRHAAEMIEQGLVTVNGTLVTEPGFRVNPEADEIVASGVRLPKATEPQRTVLLYKPRGIISSADNSRGETVCDLLKPHFPERLVPVGRLDKESEGLLLMSNDGELTHVMTHPRYGHTKTYIARVAGHMEEHKIDLLRSRMEIDGYVIQPVEVEILKVGKDHTHKLAFTLSEGRNRQIRKMCSLAHFTVLDLTRVRIGPLKICNMHPGEWRELTDAEIRALKKPAAARRPETGDRRPGNTPAARASDVPRTHPRPLRRDSEDSATDRARPYTPPRRPSPR